MDGRVVVILKMLCFFCYFVCECVVLFLGVNIFFFFSFWPMLYRS